MRLKAMGVFAVAIVLSLGIGNQAFAMTSTTFADSFTVTPATEGVFDTTEISSATHRQFQTPDSANESPAGWGGSSLKSKNGYGQKYILDVTSYGLTLNDIDSISYYTKNSDSTSAINWYLQFYTDDGGARDTGNSDPLLSDATRRINADTQNAKGLTADNYDGTVWTQWTTDTSNDVYLQFDADSTDSNDAGQIYSLADLAGGSIGSEALVYICLGVGSGWTYTGLLDGLEITLKSGSSVSVDFAATPIPGAVWLLGSGLLGLAGVRHRKKKAA